MLTGMRGMEWNGQRWERDVLVSGCEEQRGGERWKETNDWSGRKGYFLGAQFIRPAGLTGWTAGPPPATGTRLVNSDNRKHKPQSVSYDVNGIKGKRRSQRSRKIADSGSRQRSALVKQAMQLIHRTSTLIASFSIRTLTLAFHFR